MVRSRRPYREYAARLQRGMGSPQSGEVIKRIVRLARQAFRAVVDIEQNGVVGCRGGLDEKADIRRRNMWCNY